MENENFKGFKSQFKIIYNKFFRKYLKSYIFIVIIMLLTASISLVEPALNQYLIDEVIGEKKLAALPYLLCIYALVCIVNILLGFVVQKKNLYISNKSTLDIKSNIITSAQKKFNNDISDKRADVLVTVTQDVNIVSNFFNNTITNAILHFGYIVILTTYLRNFSFILTSLILINSAIQVFITYHYGNKLKDNFWEFKKNSEKEISFLNSTLINLKLIKSYRYENKSLKKYSNIFNEFKRLTWKNFKLVYRQSMLLGITNILGITINILLGTMMVANAKITLGTLVIFLTLSDNVKNSLEFLISINVSLQQFIVSLSRIHTAIEINDQNEKKLNVNFNIENITLNNIKYKYGDKIIFKDVTLELENGQTYLFVGNNGIGKSTLVNILASFNKISEGNIFFNNSEISEIEDSQLINRISIAFQKNYFLDDTIKENLLLGNESVTEEKIEGILNLVRCKEFVEKLEDGLESKMDDCNSKFSGGELQKLNIVRALLKEADVYIFDEVFSNIDKNSKLTIFKNITNYLKDKIVIFITHDEEIIYNTSYNVFVVQDTKISRLIS